MLQNLVFDCWLYTCSLQLAGCWLCGAPAYITESIHIVCRWIDLYVCVWVCICMDIFSFKCTWTMYMNISVQTASRVFVFVCRETYAERLVRIVHIYTYICVLSVLMQTHVCRSIWLMSSLEQRFTM